MNLRQKLLLATLPALFILGALGIYATLMVERLNAQAESILRANYRTLVAIHELEELRAAIDRSFFAPQGATPAGVESGLHALASGPLALQRGNITEQGEDEATARLTAAFEGWSRAVRQAASLLPGPPQAEAWLVAVRPASEELRQAGSRILTLNHDALVRKSRETSALAERLRLRLILASGAAVAALIAVGVLLAGRISGPLVELAAAARAISKGDLDRPLPRAEGGDEVATLVQEIGAMTEALREYRRSSLGELLAAQQLAQAAIDSLREPVISFGPDGRVRQVNHAAEKQLSIDADVEDPLRALPADLRRQIERARERVLSGRGEVVPEGLTDTIPAMIHGVVRQVQVHATPTVRRSGGEIVGATVLVRDVTSLYAAAAVKDDLLSTVAHELRTPLTSLRMAVHMCLEPAAGPLNDRQQDLLHAAREDSERLHRVVEGILSVARIEEGGLVSRRQLVSPADIVEAVVGPLRVNASTRGIELAAEAPGEPPCLADQGSVEIALGNIVQNALRHTPEGGKVSVRAFPLDGAVRFEVKDTGEGIAPEHHARLFSRFYRVPGSPPGGTGLGLSITRDVVHAHGGEVGVESAQGAGSLFWFTLPTGPSPSTSGAISGRQPASPT